MMRKAPLIAAVLCLGLSACGHRPDMDTARAADNRRDYATAIEHYRELSDFGLPEAKIQLAKHYLQGKGVEQNPARALALFEEASKAGKGARVTREIITAKTQLGVAAVTGRSPGVSRAQGVAFLREAAEAGDKRAIFELGNAYEKGLGVPKNTQLALKYYERAGALGYGRADYSRAQLYQKGRAVPQNLPLAVSLYKSAADKNYARANLNLSEIYGKGIGVEANPQLAQAYFEKAGTEATKNVTK